MHIKGQSRNQATLFAERLDELISEDNPVRVIDAFVDALDLLALGFGKVESQATGRPPYDPGDLLKLYVYGYMHRTRSTRRREHECHKNVEVLWLLNRLAPDFKTIANFRVDNHATLISGRSSISAAMTLIDAQPVSAWRRKLKPAGNGFICIPARHVRTAH